MLFGCVQRMTEATETTDHFSPAAHLNVSSSTPGLFSLSLPSSFGHSTSFLSRPWTTHRRETCPRVEPPPRPILLQQRAPPPSGAPADRPALQASSRTPSPPHLQVSNQPRVGRQHATTGIRPASDTVRKILSLHPTLFNLLRELIF
jgi:hypothetical protein